MHELITASLSSGEEVTLVKWNETGPVTHGARLQTTGVSEAESRSGLSFYDATKEYMRNEWAFNNLAHCVVPIDGHELALYYNKELDSWHSIDEFDIDHVTPWNKHCKNLGATTEADQAMAYNDVGNLRLLPSPYNRGRQAVDDLIADRDNPKALEDWKAKHIAFDSSPDARIAVYDPQAHAVERRGTKDQPWSAEDGRKGLNFDVNIRNTWFNQELARHYQFDASFEYEGRPYRVPIFLCEASGSYATRGAFDIDHKLPFVDQLKDARETAEREGRAFSKADALNLYNDTTNLRLVSRSANSSGDYEIDRQTGFYKADLAAEKSAGFATAPSKKDMNFIDDTHASAGLASDNRSEGSPDGLAGRREVRATYVAGPGMHWSLARQSMPANEAGRDGGAIHVHQPNVRRAGLNPDQALNHDSNPSCSSFKSVSSMVRAEYEPGGAEERPAKISRYISNFNRDEIDRIAAFAFAETREKGLAVTSVSISGHQFIVKGRSPGSENDVSLNLDLQRARNDSVETSSSKWRKQWSSDLYAPALNHLSTHSSQDRGIASPETERAAVWLAKQAEQGGVLRIDRIVDNGSGQLSLVMTGSNPSVTLKAVEVQASDMHRYLEACRDTSSRQPQEHVNAALSNNAAGHSQNDGFKTVIDALSQPGSQFKNRFNDHEKRNIAAFVISEAAKMNMPEFRVCQGNNGILIAYEPGDSPAAKNFPFDPRTAAKIDISERAPVLLAAEQPPMSETQSKQPSRGFAI